MTNDVIDKSLEAQKKKIAHYKKMIKDLYKEIKNYEHKYNDDLEKKYHSVMNDFRSAEMKLKRKHIKDIQNTNDTFADKFTNIDNEEFQQHTKLIELSSATHNFSNKEIDKVKTKWWAVD